jgi:hypothetical protein
MIEEKYRPIVSFRVSPEEWETLRSGSARAGNDESVGMYSKRLALREAARRHKKPKAAHDR